MYWVLNFFITLVALVESSFQTKPIASILNFSAYKIPTDMKEDVISEIKFEPWSYPFYPGTTVGLKANALIINHFICDSEANFK